MDKDLYDEEREAEILKNDELALIYPKKTLSLFSWKMKPHLIKKMKVLIGSDLWDISALN